MICDDMYWLEDDGTIRNIKQGEENSAWNMDKRRIARTKYDNGDFISTVFLVIDHGWTNNPDDAPILFETMIFADSDGEEYLTRCCTKEQALEMHTAAEAFYKGTKS